MTNWNIINKEKSIFNFVGKFLIFLATLFLFDFGVGKILRYFYFKQNSGVLYRTTYALDSTKADILIMGASTANHHYYPGAFEKRLNMSCYNAGRDGNYILYHYAVLKAVLKRYCPKMIILDVTRKDFQIDQEGYDRLSSLLPYYNQHPEIRSIVQLKSPYEKYKLISKIYPYNSMLFAIGAGNTELNKNREYTTDENGYVPLNSKWAKELATESFYTKYQLDSEKINIFNSFVRDCVNSKIKLLIFVSPAYVKTEYEDPSIEIIKKIAKEFNISFYSFANNSFFLNNRDLFYNPGHLNDEGAKIYSEMVVDKIIHDQ